MRASIAFGPEVTEEENKTGKTDPKIDRGLSFVCYQSNLANGFEFLQEKWANTTSFPPKTVNGTTFDPGFDPIIGQNGNNSRVMAGTNPSSQGTDLTLPIDFVVPKGGAYFFVPPISALQTTLSA